MKTILISWLLTISALLAAQRPELGWSQNRINEASEELLTFFKSSSYFSSNIPHEKVYLHFDNTNYFHYDKIWFKCYVVIAGNFRSSPLSKTLYVELLNTGGEIIDKRILKIENGQCHGEFTLNHLPFYSGFYEVRAYTKYMLNFGDDVIFSRILPVFNKPKNEGDWEEKKMLQYTKWSSFPMKRAQQEKGNKVNVRFFPEGGNLIQGVSSKVAFEATDENGNPIEVTGFVMDASNQVQRRIATEHEGRGVFSYVPASGKEKAVTEVDYEGKKYRFDLPVSQPTGVVMEVDNLKHSDSVYITVKRNEQTPVDLFGIDILGNDNPENAFIVFTQDKETHVNIGKKNLTAGVSQIVLFNRQGDVLCDRLIYNFPSERLDIKASANKPTYNSRELVEMDFRVTDRHDNPVNTTFSLSVRDGANEVDCRSNILTDLLLMSDIRGYVRNPSYYFEVDSDAEEMLPASSSTLASSSSSSLLNDHANVREMHLDQLLMVQGWRRYSWRQMAGVDPFEHEPLYFPEMGIEIHGAVVTFDKGKPRPGVDVSILLSKKDDKSVEKAIEHFVTDEKGRFSFVVDVQDTWDMVLSVMENNKKKDHLILLDRIFTPDPGSYRFADLQVSISESNDEISAVEETIVQEMDADYEDYREAAIQDSLSKLGIDKRTIHLPEVTVKANRRTREQQIFSNRSTSIAYYDVHTEIDNIYDRGDYMGDNLYEFLNRLSFNYVNKKTPEIINSNEGFRSAEIEMFKTIDASRESDDNVNQRFYTNQDEASSDIFDYPFHNVMYYKGKPMLFVVDYKPTEINIFEYLSYNYLRLPAIKSIYINENTSVIADYIITYSPMETPLQLAMKYSCVVFIETYPDGKIPAAGAKGVRKTRLDGYSSVLDFYKPNFLEPSLEPDPDYRRTLYWNPSVTTDETGSAKIKFFNNNTCKKFSISAETITSQGMIGVLAK